MNSNRFKELLDELDGNSLQTLKERNGKYSVNGDCLHNFREGAEIMGGTPAQACWGYMTKHLVALRDKVNRNDFSDREDLLEKCQDIINYIRFLWCIGNDDPNTENLLEVVDKLDEAVQIIYPTCEYGRLENGTTKCMGTKEFDPCVGYAACEFYKRTYSK